MTVDPNVMRMAAEAVMYSIDRCLARANATLARPERVELPELAKHWRRALALAGDDLAIQVVRELPLGALGLFSYLPMSASNLEQALELADNALKQMTPIRIRVVAGGPGVVDVRFVGDGDRDTIAVLEQLALAFVVRHLDLLDKPVRPRAVWFRCSSPRDSFGESFCQFFGVVPRFDQSATLFRVATEDLVTKLRTADQRLQQLAALDPHTAPRPSSMTDQVAAHLKPRLRDPIELDAIAQALGLTSRSLQRRLQEEHTTLRQLATRVRIEVACELLDQGSAVAAAAEAVGYASAAAFTRAFSDVMNMSPLAYRKRDDR